MRIKSLTQDANKNWKMTSLYGIKMILAWKILSETSINEELTKNLRIVKRMLLLLCTRLRPMRKNNTAIVYVVCVPPS